MALLELQQEVDNKSKFASFFNQGRCFWEESGTHLFQLQVFRKYLLKIAMRWLLGDVILFFPFTLAFKENAIFWKNLFIIVQVLVPVIPEDGLPATLKEMMWHHNQKIIQINQKINQILSIPAPRG